MRSGLTRRDFVSDGQESVEDGASGVNNSRAAGQSNEEVNMKKFPFLMIAIAVVATLFVGAASECSASGILDRLTPELIGAYEREVANEAIVSGKSAAQLKKMSEMLGVEVQRVKAAIILQDLAGRVGEPRSLSSIAGMNDVNMLLFAKECGEKYLATLSEQRRAELKAVFLAALKA